MTTQKPISKSPISDAFLSKNAEGNNLSNGCFCARCKNITSFSFTGKEKDPETGFSYFGARYLDHELMTMWLSVDPMADKYPKISPYAYCAWNPVRLVDPEGDTVVITGSLADKCVDYLDSEHLKIIRDSETGVLSVKFKGKYSEMDLNKYEQLLYNSILSEKCKTIITAEKTVNVIVEDDKTIKVFTFNGERYQTIFGGSFMGTIYDPLNKTALSKSFIDPLLLMEVGFEQGVAHEVIEGYLCALKSIQKCTDIPIAVSTIGTKGTNPDIKDACDHSVPYNVLPGELYYFGPNAGRIKSLFPYFFLKLNE